MTWISYYLAITTPAGSPPKDFDPPPGTVKRWCFKCNNYKPERSHHCKTCKTCVLKMDHHCPWTYNCVGYNNMPHFIRFLLWVDVTSGYGFYRLILRCMSLYRARGLPAYLIPLREILGAVVLTPLTFFVLLSVGILSIRVAMNLVGGITQIESWEEERIASAKRRNLVPRNTQFPYDISIWYNILSAWGPMWSWLLPFGGPPGDGTQFPKNESGFTEEGDPIYWPPDQREILKPDNYEDQDESVSRSFGTGPITFAQTSLANSQQFRRLHHDPANRLYNRSRSASVASNSSDEDTGYPDWRDQVSSDADFYKREQFETFEGEKLSDFGVDLDSEAPRRPRRQPPPPSARQRSNNNVQYSPSAGAGSSSTSLLLDHDADDDLPLAALMAKRRQEKNKVA